MKISINISDDGNVDIDYGKLSGDDAEIVEQKMIALQRVQSIVRDELPEISREFQNMQPKVDGYSDAEKLRENIAHLRKAQAVEREKRAERLKKLADLDLPADVKARLSGTAPIDAALAKKRTTSKPTAPVKAGATS